MRWDEFLPVRGKWARRLLLLPFALALWVLRGIHVEVPGWYSLNAECHFLPECGTPQPPQPYVGIVSSAFAPAGWGQSHERKFHLGEMRYCVTTWSRISDEEAKRHGLPVD